jgi:hypothetical protein
MSYNENVRPIRIMSHNISSMLIPMRRYAADRLRIVDANPTGDLDVCLLGVLCVSGRGLCVGSITRPEQSYRARCVHLSVIVKPRYCATKSIKYRQYS